MPEKWLVGEYFPPMIHLDSFSKTLNSTPWSQAEVLIEQPPAARKVSTPLFLAELLG